MVMCSRLGCLGVCIKPGGGGGGGGCGGTSPKADEKGNPLSPECENFG